jgi:hypothetical protein
VQVYGTILLVDTYAIYFAAGALGLLFLLHIFDVSYWTGRWKVLRAFLFTFVALGFAGAAMLASKEYPGASIALYVLAFPALLWLIKLAVYRNVHAALFSKSLCVALFIIAAATAAVWLVWVFTGNPWNNETKIAFSDLLYCKIEVNGTTAAAMPVANMTAITTTTTTTMFTTTFFDDHTVTTTTVPFFAGSEDDDRDITVCLAAWVLWTAPLLAACNAFVFGLLSYALSRTLLRTDKAVTKALKLFLGLIVVAVVCLWVAASIAGAGIGVNGAVQLFVGVFIMVLSGVLIGTVGWKRLTAQMMAVPLVRQLSSSLFTDWFKALFMIGLGPFLPFYFLTAVVNQMLRKCLPFGYTIDNDREQKLRLTAAASAQLRAIKRWRWSSILEKIMWIGVIYAILEVVVALMTNIFMSWLNDVLLPLPLYATTLIFFVVGVLLLNLPPVPAVPIFVTAGIILGQQGEKDLTFAGAQGLAILVCVAIKLVSGLMLQKLHGERLGKSLYVRREIGVNSISVRAIRRLLIQPGIKMPKVCILIGGPDYPCYALPGILKLSVWQVQLASLPVVVLIAPLSLAGGFLLKAREGGIWEAISNVALTIAILLQIIVLLLALYYVAEEVEQNYEALSREPDDEEVAAAEGAANERMLITQARQSWYAKDFPMLARLLLISGAMATIASIYMLVVAHEKAFSPFAVTDNISEKINGDINNLVHLLGWVYLGLLGWAILVLILWGRVTAYRVKHLPADFQVPTAMRDQMAVNPIEGADADEIFENIALDEGDIDVPLRKPAAPKTVVVADVANVFTSVLAPDARADAEAQAYKDRKRAHQKMLKENAAYKDTQK